MNNLVNAWAEPMFRSVAESGNSLGLLGADVSALTEQIRLQNQENERQLEISRNEINQLQLALNNSHQPIILNSP